LLTDRPPLKPTARAEFRKSDRLVTLSVPEDDRFKNAADAIRAALVAEDARALRSASARFLEVAARFYQVSVPKVLVLAARPIRVWEGGIQTELYGDYNVATPMIRVWMRTAVQKRPTSFGTFFSTLCHEFCHHLDFEKFGFRHSPHTRGFYERIAVLYDHGCKTPKKRLFWIPLSFDCWAIDWPRVNLSGRIQKRKNLKKRIKRP